MTFVPPNLVNDLTDYQVGIECQYLNEEGMVRYNSIACSSYLESLFSFVIYLKCCGFLKVKWSSKEIVQVCH